MQVTTGDQQNCNKFVFQNGILQEGELDDDDDGGGGGGDGDGDGDKERSYRRLKFGYVKGETESTAEAAQDQTVSSDGFKNRIWKEETENKRRLCKHYEESIVRLTGIRMAQFGKE
jgi:hypothetical protein